MSGRGEVNHAYRQTLIRLAQMLSYNSIPVGFPELKDYLEEALKPSPAPMPSSTTEVDFSETQYAAIVIPNTFENADTAIFCYQALLAQSRQILESDIELELEFFNEYLSHLDYFQDHVELYEAVYKKTSILEKPSQTRADFEILNEQENILYQYPRHAFENELDEAEKFAHTRCHFDERVKDFEKTFHAFREYLCAKISSAMGKTEEEFLRTLEIYKNSSAAVVVAPKPRKATISHSLFEPQSSVEEELPKSLDLSNAP
jgi:hypothetical protein